MDKHKLEKLQQLYCHARFTKNILLLIEMKPHNSVNEILKNCKKTADSKKPNALQRLARLHCACEQVQIAKMAEPEI